MSLRPYFFAVLCLSACVDVDTYHQLGVSPQKQSSDLLDCQLAGAQDVPTNTQVRTTPTYTTPVRTSCFEKNGKTECTTTGGEVRGGRTYSFDANEKLRGAVIDRCMARRGYAKYTLPQCTSRDTRGRDLSYATLPPVTSNTCVVKSGERWVFVNP